MRKVVLGAAAALAAAPAAHAGLWSTAGGDPGRSGFQPRASGSGPYELLWSATQSSSQDVGTSVVVTGAGATGERPRAVFGTKGGRIQLRDLFTGEAVGDPDGVRLGIFGSPSVLTPVDSSDDGTLGQLFVLVNDAPPKGQVDGSGEPIVDALVIAQIDEQTGKLVQQARVPGTEELVASSAPLLGEPNTTGDRSLVFTATDGKENDVVVRVPIKRAQSVTASLDVADAETSTVTELSPTAPPTLLVADDQTGRRNSRPVAFATVASGAPDAPLTSLQVDALGTAGPASQRLDRAATEKKPVYVASVAVPVTPSGFAPGTGTSGAGRAGAVFATTYDPAADRTVAHRLVLTPDGTGLITSASSTPIAGRAAPGLTTTQNGQAPGDDAGTLVVTTSRSLVALDGGDLSRRWGQEDLKPEDTGFGHTSASVMNGVVFVSRDNGQRLALDLSDGTPLAKDAFDTTTAAQATVRSVGAPAVTSAGIVVFASDKGVVAFRNRCGNRIGGTSAGEPIAGTLAGDDVQAGGGNDTVDGKPGDDCIDAGAGDDVVGGDAGLDRLIGGDGNDRVLGGAEADQLDGGAGADRLSGDDADDTVNGGADRDVLKGGAGDDLLSGGDGDDRAYGGAGADRISGGPGADRLSGGAGDDRLRGGPGRDVLVGGNGADVLTSGAGAGRLSGGAGTDALYARNGARDVVRCGAGKDLAVVDPGDRVEGCETVRGRRARR